MKRTFRRRGAVLAAALVLRLVLTRVRGRA